MKAVLPSLRRTALAAIGLFGLAGAAHADAPAPERSQARFEENFLSDMIDHHQVGVEMAKLAATRATHPELRALASMIQTSQKAQIETMSEWLEEWYDVEYEVELDRRAERRVAALGELDGEAFEREYMTEMALHHADALEEAGQALLRGYHADLIGLARDILSLQADELALLRIWLNQWHDVAQVTAQDRGIDLTDEATEDDVPHDPHDEDVPVRTDDELVPLIPPVTTTPPATTPTAVTTSPNGESVATDTSLSGLPGATNTNGPTTGE